MERQQDFGYYENQPHHKTSMTVSKLKNRSSTIGHLPYFWLVVAGFIAVAGITLNALRSTYGFQGVHLWLRKHFYIEHQHNHIVCFYYSHGIHPLCRYNRVCQISP